MRNFIIIIYLSIVGVGIHNSYGQNNWAAEVYSTQGLLIDKINLPASLKTASNSAKFSKSFGYSFHLGFLYQLNPKWQLSSGMRIAKMGNSFETRVEDMGGYVHNISEEVSLNYIQIPFAVRFKLFDKEKISVFTSLGIYVGYLLNAKRGFHSNYYWEASNNSKITYTMIDEVTGSKIDFKYTLESNPYKRFDFGPMVQSGIYYQISPKILIPISWNMTYGLNKVQNDKALYNTVNSPSALFWDDYVFNKSTHNFLTGLSVGVIYFLE